MKKQMISALLCAAMGMTAFSGTTVGAAGEDGSFTYTLPGKYLNWLQDLNYWEDMQVLSGISVELVNGGENDGSYYQNIDLSVGNGNLTDAVIVRQSQASVYQAQGAFMDLTEVIEEYAPNVKAYLEANPDYASMCLSSEGEIYGLPGQNPLYNNLTFYRADMFEKAGITEMPTTIEEFTEVLRTLKETFGSETGYYPWVGRDSYLHFAECFGCLDYIDEEGTVHGIYNNSLSNGKGYDIHTEGFREMVEWYNTLYTEGLIDPEWVSGTATEEDWQTKYLTGKGSVCDDFFTRPTWFMSNSEDESCVIEVMDLFKTTDGQDAKRYQRMVNTEWYLVIPEGSENVESVMKFLDWLYSEEGQEIMHYGIDGINTIKNDDGTHTWIADFAVEAVKPVGEPNIGLYQDRLTFPYPVDNQAYYESLDKNVQSYCIDYFNKNSAYAKQIVYTEEQTEERSNLMAKYQTQFDAQVLSFVKGETEINDDTWAAFLENMEIAGYSEINAIDQEAYDAMK